MRPVQISGPRPAGLFRFPIPVRRRGPPGRAV